MNYGIKLYCRKRVLLKEDLEKSFIFAEKLKDKNVGEVEIACTLSKYPGGHQILHRGLKLNLKN